MSFITQTDLTKDLENIYRVFEGILGDLGQIYIAGGAVRDTLIGRRPKDYDVFVLVNPDKQIGVDDISGALVSKAGSFKRRVQEMLRLRGIKDSIAVKSDSMGVISNVEYQTTSGLAHVQVILSTEDSVYSLLEHFDWNICLFAYGYMPHSDEIGLYCPTPVTDLEQGKSLSINHLRFPYRALRRGYRFSERYGLKLEEKDVREIARHILDNPESTEKHEFNLWKRMNKGLDDEKPVDAALAF